MKTQQLLRPRRGLLNLVATVDDAAKGTQQGSIADDSGRAVADVSTVSSSGVLGPGSHGTNDEYSVGLQFDSGLPPQGRTIRQAILVLAPFTTYDAAPGTVKLYVSAHAADAPAALSTIDGDLRVSVRPRTTATTIADVTSIGAGIRVRVDITDVIQEIVDRPGYDASRIIILLDTHEDTTSGEWQEFHDYDTIASAAPQLITIAS